MRFFFVLDGFAWCGGVGGLSRNDDVLLCEEVGNSDEGRCVGLVEHC